MDKPQLDDLVFSIDIHAPVESVWEEITKTGRIQRALYNTVLESDFEPGGKLRYYSPNRKRVFVVGEVLEVVPLKRFKHTYVFTMRNDEPTTVTWELEEIPDGCRVTLVHGGWAESQAKARKDSGGGWEEILGLLKSEVETGAIPFKTRATYAMMGLFSFMLPSSTRIDEVEKAGW